MAFCKNCGNEVAFNDQRCSKCGTQLKQSAPVVKDDGGFLWGLLGFCVPIVGLILYFVWKDERPNTAKALITGTLISIALGVISALFNGALLATM